MIKTATAVSALGPNHDLAQPTNQPDRCKSEPVTSNAQRVKLFRTILEHLGLEIATPDQARERLNLKGRTKSIFEK